MNALLTKFYLKLFGNNTCTYIDVSIYRPDTEHSTSGYLVWTFRLRTFRLRTFRLRTLQSVVQPKHFVGGVRMVRNLGIVTCMIHLSNAITSTAPAMSFPVKDLSVHVLPTPMCDVIFFRALGARPGTRARLMYARAPRHFEDHNQCTLSQRNRLKYRFLIDYIAVLLSQNVFLSQTRQCCAVKDKQ